MVIETGLLFRLGFSLLRLSQPLLCVYFVLRRKRGCAPPMSTVTVSEKGQVVIPAPIRRLGIAPGSKLDFDLEGDSIRIRLRKSIPPSSAEDRVRTLALQPLRRTPADGFRRRGCHAGCRSGFGR